jgi:hypothetical protein
VLTGTRRKAVFGLLLAAAVVSLFAQAPFIVRGLTVSQGGDFGTFYRAARNPAQLYEPAPERPQAVDLTPPHLHLLIAPLTAWPVMDAFRIWMIISFTVLGMVLMHTVRPWPWWGLPVLVFWAPTTTLLALGQVTAVLAVPVALSWWEDRRGHSYRAGAWLGPVLVTKPILLVVPLYWSLQRRASALSACAATGALTVLAGMTVYGTGAYTSWLRNFDRVTWHWQTMNASLSGALARACGPAGTFTPFASCAPWVGWVFLVILASLFAATAWVLSRPGVTTDRAWAVALTAMLLLSPLGWVYYVWWLVPPVWYAGVPGPAAVVGILLLLAPPWANWLLGHSGPILGATVGSMYSYGLLAWWAGLFWRTWSERTVQRESHG